jgi:YhcH/YjgK/YiaL family protein
MDKLGKYQGINPLFADVVEFLKKNDLNVMEDGKYPIKGKDLFLNLTTAKGKAPDEAEVETHVKMIDIQMPLDGPETYGYTPLCNLPEEEYNAEKDVTMYPGLMAESFIDCQPGMFAIFCPQDGHAPCITMAPEIRKAIFKVKA